MSILAAIRVALASLFVHKGRSALTSLGIVIGIGAVIAMVAAADGARHTIDDRMSTIGTNLILVRGGAHTTSGSVADYKVLKNSDAEVIRKHLGHLVRGVAEIQLSIRTASTGSRNWSTVVNGTSPAQEQVREWRLTHGRFFSHEEQRAAAPVCVLGRTVKDNLFPNLENPVGQVIRIDRLRLHVVGVLASKGRTIIGGDQDDEIFVPLTTLQKKLVGQEGVNALLTAPRDPNMTGRVMDEINRLLRENHRVKEGQEDFDVASVEEMAQIGYTVSDTLKLLMAVVASLSLLVGGIGVMNIMLVSVTERTREIGLRMAVGATPFDVLTQFLLEAVVLSLTGGVLGVTLGLGAALTLAQFTGWPLLVSPFVVLGAFAVAGGVGVFFGFYPAWKASRLDPIEALRQE